MEERIENAIEELRKLESDANSLVLFHISQAIDQLKIAKKWATKSSLNETETTHASYLGKEMNWKLKLMQIINEVGRQEGVWFTPWAGVTQEEQKIIELEYEKYEQARGDTPERYYE